MEKAVLIGCQTNQRDEQFYASLEELKSLADTAKATVISTFTQKRDRVDASTYIGSGKLEELKKFEEENEVDLFIFNDELSPSQIRNVSRVLDAKVIDRTQLILDIFAMRARSSEGKIQVELAQLEYQLPRLTGQGILLSRLGGGIGTRGPGETKLETDRRHIYRRITELKRALHQIKTHRENIRERRKQNRIFQVGIIGYTNAGKSTLFNALTHADTLAENKLFATLDPLSRKLELSMPFNCIVTDTVGFIQDLPTSLIAAFRSTLEETKDADLLLHVIDASNPDYRSHEKTVLKLLREVNSDKIPIVTVYNKMDLPHLHFQEPSQIPFLCVSSLRLEDIQLLKDSILQSLLLEMEEYKIKIPLKDSKSMAILHEHSIVLESSFLDNQEAYQLRGYIRKDSSFLSLITTFTLGEKNHVQPTSHAIYGMDSEN